INFSFAQTKTDPPSVEKYNKAMAWILGKAKAYATSYYKNGDWEGDTWEFSAVQIEFGSDYITITQDAERLDHSHEASKRITTKIPVQSLKFILVKPYPTDDKYEPRNFYFGTTAGSVQEIVEEKYFTLGEPRQRTKTHTR